MSDTMNLDKANLLQVSPVFTSIGIYVDVESANLQELLEDAHTFSHMAATLVAAVGEQHRVVKSDADDGDTEIRMPRSALQAAYVTELLLSLAAGLLSEGTSRAMAAHAREEELQRENDSLRSQVSQLVASRLVGGQVGKGRKAA